MGAYLNEGSNARAVNAELHGINYRTDPANPGYKHHTCVIERWAKRQK